MKCDEIFAALALLEKERGIPQDFMMEKIVQALVTAYKRDHEDVENVVVDVNEEKRDLKMFVEKTVSNFMDWLRAQPDGTTYRAMGDILYNAYAYNTKGEYYPGFGSNFRSKWQEVAQNNRTEFAQAQTNVENAVIAFKDNTVVMVIASNECTADLDSAVDNALA